jgi:hypothetical protein
MPTIAILSIGEMGLGIGQLLKAHDYKVVTYAEDRRCGNIGQNEEVSLIQSHSQGTKHRAQSAGIDLVPSLEILFEESDYLLSIVPPRDAVATAKRMVLLSAQPRRDKEPLYYLDLNAVSPRTAREIEALFDGIPSICFIDGGIIGGVPYQKKAPDPSNGDCLRSKASTGLEAVKGS